MFSPCSSVRMPCNFSCLILYLRSLSFKELNFTSEKEALICFCVSLSILTNFEFKSIPVLIVKGFAFNSKSWKLYGQA